MDYLRKISMETGTGSPEAASPAFSIGPYQVLCEIGRGFSSVVYQAIDPRRRRTVALKVLTFPQTISALQRGDLIRRFVREAQAISALSHPGIVAVYEAGEANDGRQYLAMERLQGETLRERLNRESVIPLTEAAAIALQIADALHYAHGRGIIHRDIKPDNIFLVSSPTLGEPVVKLMDFGIAHILGDQGLTQDGTIVGSPAYMSPEQINGTALDRRTDLFSLGIVLTEMLCGSKPFEASSIPAVMNRILHHPPQLDAIQPRSMQRVLAQALAKSPSARYPDAPAFAAALREAVTEPLAWELSVPTEFVESPQKYRAGLLSRIPAPSPTAFSAAALGLTLLALPLLLMRHAPPSRVIVITPGSFSAAGFRQQIPTAWQRVTAPPVLRLAPISRRTFAPAAPLPPAKPMAPIMVVTRTVSALRKPIVKVADSRQEMRFPIPISPVNTTIPTPPMTETITPSPAEDSAPTEMPLPPREAGLGDSPPRALRRDFPTLPPGAAAEGQTVRLRVSVNEDGDVTNISVLSSAGDPALDAAAIAAVRGWEYDPAIHDGQSAGGTVIEEVKFN